MGKTAFMLGEYKYSIIKHEPHGEKPRFYVTKLGHDPHTLCVERTT